MEALEQWYAAKAAPNAAVPMHRISIDVFSGASAGGMCAAIAAVMLQGPFEHIRNPFDSSIKDTTNKFDESWVNKVDVEYLLEDRDLGDNKPVISVLDSTVIDDIANYALVAGIPVRREYISGALTLFLSLTNVRGTPFSLSGSGDGSAEEQVAYYADKLQFETVAGNANPGSPSARPLPLGSNGLSSTPETLVFSPEGSFLRGWSGAYIGPTGESVSGFFFTPACRIKGRPTAREYSGSASGELLYKNRFRIVLSSTNVF
jgi:hypothetical protein